MTNKTIKILGIFAALLMFMPNTEAKNRSSETEVLSMYYTHSSSEPVGMDKDGFIQRWMMLEPIKIDIRANSALNSEFIANTISVEHFKGQNVLMPYDGQTVKVGKDKHVWHALDTKKYFVNLMRFAEGYGKEYYGQMYWVVTVVNCDEDITDVRLSAGANSAAVWWLNGEKVLTLSDDRDLIMDDCVSKRISLKKGENVIRGVVFNGPGMADFCLRFVDENGNPVKNLSVTAKLKK